MPEDKPGTERQLQAEDEAIDDQAFVGIWMKETILQQGAEGEDDSSNLHRHRPPHRPPLKELLQAAVETQVSQVEESHSENDRYRLGDMATQRDQHRPKQKKQRVGRKPIHTPRTLVEVTIDQSQNGEQSEQNCMFDMQGIQVHVTLPLTYRPLQIDLQW